jgi:hypothetical protein
MAHTQGKKYLDGEVELFASSNDKKYDILKDRGIVNVGEVQVMKLGIPSTDRYSRLDSWPPDIDPS